MTKKIREPPNVTMEELYKMLVLLNVMLTPPNRTKKIKELPNVTIIQSYVMFIISNLTLELSNVSKKQKTTKCNYDIVICDVDTI